jgi:hypothetical protein
LRCSGEHLTKSKNLGTGEFFVRRYWWACISLALLASGCGSGGGGGNEVYGSTGGGPVSTPVVVSVTAGGFAQGVNITVFNPATPTPPAPPNAELLGVQQPGTTFSLFNTGDTISRSVPGPQLVALCGPGLSQNMTVTIAGPSSDFTVSNITGSTTLCKPTSGGGSNVPGIEFDLTVNPAATLGARTVILQNSPDNDITTFTGGLEVVP